MQHGIFRMNRDQLLAAMQTAADRGCDALFLRLAEQVRRVTEGEHVPSVPVVHVPNIRDDRAAATA